MTQLFLARTVGGERHYESKVSWRLGISSEKSVNVCVYPACPIDDNRYQSIPIDINLSIDIDNRPIDGKDSCGYRLHGIGFQ